MIARKYILSLGLIVCSIVSTYFVTVSTAQQGTTTAPATADNEYQVGAVLYMQKAAEYRAMAYQAFNLARWQLDADLDKKNAKKLPKAERIKPRAVMVDIDETDAASGLWRVEQIIDDPEGHHDWRIRGEVDLVASEEAGTAIVRVIEVLRL